MRASPLRHRDACLLASRSTRSSRYRWASHLLRDHLDTPTHLRHHRLSTELPHSPARLRIVTRQLPPFAQAPSGTGPRFSRLSPRSHLQLTTTPHPLIRSDRCRRSKLLWLEQLQSPNQRSLSNSQVSMPRSCPKLQARSNRSFL